MDRRRIVITGSFPRYSEAWLPRMTSLIDGHVSTIYIKQDGRRKEDKEEFVLGKLQSRFPNRLLSDIGDSYVSQRTLDLLKRLCGTSEVNQTPILIHYINNAVLLRKLWRKIDSPVYVHCHGQDVTWDRRLDKLPVVRVHPRNYLTQSRELQNRVTFIANSCCTKQKLVEEGFREDRIVVKYLGVEIDDQTVELSGQGEPLRILYLGRFVDFKGPNDVIRAFDLACSKGMHASLVMAGGGPLFNDCKRIAASSKFRSSISLLGPVASSEAKQLIRCSDVITAHNRRSSITGQEEAYGVSIVEAMAAGRPVVTASSGGVQETVEHDVTGYLVTPGDIEAHAEALQRLANDRQLLKKMGRAAYERSRKRFSVAAEKIALNDILSGTSGSWPGMLPRS